MDFGSSRTGFVPILPTVLLFGVLGMVLATGSAFGAVSLARAHRTVVRLSGENARLSREVALDPLTGLANRRGIVHALEAALGRPNARTAVVYLDLDHFKNVNDGHGHRCGDQVLVAVAERLRDCVPSDACAGRLGGDELVVVLSDSPRSSSAADLAITIHRELARPLVIEGVTEPLRLTVSVGVAAVVSPSGSDVDTGSTDADDLLDRANEAMRRAKSAGRDRVMAALGT